MFPAYQPRVGRQKKCPAGAGHLPLHHRNLPVVVMMMVMMTMVMILSIRRAQSPEKNRQTEDGEQGSLERHDCFSCRTERLSFRRPSLVGA